jgi:hypothetical protein
MAKMKYTVTNAYNIAGETTHRKVEVALKTASKREGDGWIVMDEDGNQWTTDFDGHPICLNN